MISFLDAVMLGIQALLAEAVKAKKEIEELQNNQIEATSSLRSTEEKRKG